MMLTKVLQIIIPFFLTQKLICGLLVPRGLSLLSSTFFSSIFQHLQVAVFIRAYIRGSTPGADLLSPHYPAQETH
jgi:hypothetical protein